MMMKIILSAILITGCTQKVKEEELSDEFVLIEFAAMLEEDHEKFEKEKE